jgi:hypothetical protein
MASLYNPANTQYSQSLIHHTSVENNSLYNNGVGPGLSSSNLNTSHSPTENPNSLLSESFSISRGPGLIMEDLRVTSRLPHSTNGGIISLKNILDLPPVDVISDLSPIETAIYLLQQFVSHRHEGSKGDQIYHLKVTIDQIKKEINNIIKSSGGNRKRSKTHKRAHKNKHRHTRTRK